MLTIRRKKLDMSAAEFAASRRFFGVSRKSAELNTAAPYISRISLQSAAAIKNSAEIRRMYKALCNLSSEVPIG